MPFPCMHVCFTNARIQDICRCTLSLVQRSYTRIFRLRCSFRNRCGDVQLNGYALNAVIESTSDGNAWRLRQCLFAARQEDEPSLFERFSLRNCDASISVKRVGCGVEFYSLFRVQRRLTTSARHQHVIDSNEPWKYVKSLGDSTPSIVDARVGSPMRRIPELTHRIISGYRFYPAAGLCRLRNRFL